MSYRGYKTKREYEEAMFNRYTGRERKMMSKRAKKGWATRKRKKKK